MSKSNPKGGENNMNYTNSFSGFWNEVSLRSQNNYGDWKGDKEVARDIVLTAINDVLHDIEEHFANVPGKIDDIVKEMCQ